MHGRMIRKRMSSVSICADKHMFKGTRYGKPRTHKNHNFPLGELAAQSVLMKNGKLGKKNVQLKSAYLVGTFFCSIESYLTFDTYTPVCMSVVSIDVCQYLM